MVKKNGLQQVYFVGFIYMIIDVGHIFKDLSTQQGKLFTLAIKDACTNQAAPLNTQNIGFITAPPIYKYTRFDKIQVFEKALTLLRLKFQMQHSEPFGHRMLRWTYEASTSAARTVA